MKPQRRFHRIPLDAKIALQEGEVSHPGNLENASLNGALASFSDRVPVHAGERCVLTIYVEGDDTPLRIDAEVVQTCFTMVGMQFVSPDEETLLRLYRVLEKNCHQPAVLRAELELIRGRLCDHVRSARGSDEDRAAP